MRRRSQDGYALLVVLLVLSLFILALAKAVPDWKTQVQREREARMIDHAREYRTAIRRYYHKYGRYPPNLDALTHQDTQGLHYLREAWPDPLNMKGDADGAWQILSYGQADSAKIVDQPPAAATKGISGIAGPNLAAAPTGGVAIGGTGSASQPIGNAGMAPGLTSGLGAAVTSSPGSGVGSGPIIGVASLNKDPAVHAFNGFDIPNDWQFVYNFAQDPTLRTTGVAAPGAGGTGTPGTGTQTPGLGVGTAGTGHF